MPPTERRKSDDALRQEVAALTVSLVGLQKTLKEAATKQDVKNLAEATHRVRKRVALTIVASVLFSFLAIMGVNNYAITHCFLSGTTAGLQHSALCNTLFFGYNNAADQNERELRAFENLIGQVPKNELLNRRQNQQLDRLQREVDKLRAQGGR